jgi:hypothetical protein
MAPSRPCGHILGKRLFGPSSAKVLGDVLQDESNEAALGRHCRN